MATFPWEKFRCAACEYFGQPKYSNFYKISLVINSVFLAGCLFLFFQSHGDTLVLTSRGARFFGPISGIFFSASVYYYLLTNRNGVRCRNCGGILE